MTSRIIGPRRRAPARAAALAALPLLLLAGCESATGVDAQVYALASVSNLPLPAPYYAFAGLGVGPIVHEVVSGKLTLREDGTAREELTIRCKSPLPPGTGCAVTNGGRVERVLTWSREEGVVRSGSTAYPLAFEQGGVGIVWSNGLVYQYR